MRLSEALEAVNGFYTPGTIGFYSKMTPDPWQENQDRLEKAALLMDESLTDLAADLYVVRSRELVDRFIRESKGERKTCPQEEGFMLGSERRHADYRSGKEKRCAYCSGADRLSIQPVKAGSFEVRVVCEACKAQKAVG